MHINFLELMAIPTLPNCSECWVPCKRDIKQMESLEIKLLQISERLCYGRLCYGRLLSVLETERYKAN